MSDMSKDMSDFPDFGTNNVRNLSDKKKEKEKEGVPKTPRVSKSSSSSSAAVDLGVQPEARTLASYPEGSLEWCAVLRDAVKTTCADMEQRYMELARLLYLASEIPVDGVPAYTRWGFVDFKAYAEQEVELHPRKAQSLKRIWQVMEVNLAGKLPEDLKRSIIRLGWSKVREIVRVINEENATYLLDVASRCNYQELMTWVTRYKAESEATASGQVKSTGTVSTKPSSGFSSSTGSTAEGSSDAIATDGDFGDDDGVGDDDDDLGGETGLKQASFPSNGIAMNDLPKADITDTPKSVMFALFEGQRKSVNLALEKVQTITNSQVRSHNLTMICEEFLATHTFAKDDSPLESKMAYISQLEELTQMRFIVVDSKSMAVIHGMGLLKKLAEGGDDESTG